jgi:hypothetical protein
MVRSKDGRAALNLFDTAEKEYTRKTIMMFLVTMLTVKAFGGASADETATQAWKTVVAQEHAQGRPKIGWSEELMSVVSSVTVSTILRHTAKLFGRFYNVGMVSRLSLANGPRW